MILPNSMHISPGSSWWSKICYSGLYALIRNYYLAARDSAQAPWSTCAGRVSFCASILSFPLYICFKETDWHDSFANQRSLRLKEAHVPYWLLASLTRFSCYRIPFGSFCVLATLNEQNTGWTWKAFSIYQTGIRPATIYMQSRIGADIGVRINERLGSNVFEIIWYPCQQ
jgi:hypothetical protein